MPISSKLVVALSGLFFSGAFVAADAADVKPPAKPAPSGKAASTDKSAETKAAKAPDAKANNAKATDSKVGMAKGGHPENWGLKFTDAERAEMKKESDAIQKALCDKHYTHGTADLEKSQVEKGYLEAVALFKEKKFAEAKARFTKAIEANDKPEEKALYKTLVMATFKHSRNYVGRASCCYEMQDYAGAVKDADEAIKICPDYSQPYIVRARAYKALKLPDAYIKDVNTASSLDTMPRALVMDMKSMGGLMKSTSRIFAQKIRGMENRVAEKTFVNGAAGLKKSQYFPMMREGLELENRNDFKAAQTKFGLVLKALHDPAELALWKDKSALDRRRASAYQHLAFCKLNLKEYNDAIGYLTEAIKLDPNGSQAYINRSKAYAKIGKMKESEADAAKAASIKPAPGQTSGEMD